MKKQGALIFGLALLTVLSAYAFTFTVKYHEVAVRSRFGETDAQSIVREPGLNFRLPVFVDRVVTLDTRLQAIETPLEEITTADGLQIVVQAWLLWKVDSEGDAPLEFLENYGELDGAAEPVETAFRTATTGAISAFPFEDLLSNGTALADAESGMLNNVRSALDGRGVECVAVGVKRLMLPPRTSRSVLERMKATRDVLARSEEAKGKAEASRIRAEASTKADRIRAYAGRRAEEIRAEGEARAAKYLEQMQEEPELATFLVWLDALQRSLSKNTTLILPWNAAPWHLMQPDTAAQTAAGDIPQPVAVGP